ncbi:MAG: hypothetical protein WAT58_07540 [Candidatus Dormiibacterota bacterium]
MTASQPQLPMDALQERLLPVADAFMILMWSRPTSGTLRDTRVTLATILLGAAVVLALGLPSVALIVYSLLRLEPLLLIPGVLCLLLGLGAAAVTVFGVRQRVLARRVARA